MSLDLSDFGLSNQLSPFEMEPGVPSGRTGPNAE
jgi:hypothetical protein